MSVDTAHLPPAAFYYKDRRFLQQVYTDVANDLGAVDTTKPEQVYNVYKGAFNKVIDYVTVYKPLLTAIKAEYDELLDTVRRGHKEAAFLHGHVQTLSCQSSTLENYRKRCLELEEKIGCLRDSNLRIEAAINEARANRVGRQETEEAPTLQIPKRPIRRETRRLPGLNLDEVTELSRMNQELKKLDLIFQDLQTSKTKKFLPRERKVMLSTSLHDKLTRSEQTREQVAQLRGRRDRLRAGVEAARSHVEGGLHSMGIGEAVLRRLHSESRKVEATEAGSNDKDSPAVQFPSNQRQSLERNETDLLAYLARFQQLMRAGDYERAAHHAAVSPRGVLRTMDTLIKFKGADELYPNRHILFTFCKILVDTVVASTGERYSPLGEEISFECLQCALDCDRMDLVEHWISTERLTLGELLGDLLVSHCATTSNLSNHQTGLDLAAHIYETVANRTMSPALNRETRARCLDKTVECLLKTGRVEAALDRGAETLTSDDLVTLLRCYPGIQLALALIGSGRVGWPQVVACFNQIDRLHLLALVMDTWIRQAVNQGQSVSAAIDNLVTAVGDEEQIGGVQMWEALLASAAERSAEIGPLVYLYDLVGSALVILTLQEATVAVEMSEVKLN